jgi:lysozyme
LRLIKVAVILTLLLCPTQVTDVTISDNFVAHIERLEGFRARLYKDAGGVPTIGYGHVPEPGEQFEGRTLTREEALSLLKHDVEEAEAAVNRLVAVNLKQEQFDALVSFVFNVGEGAFAGSTLLRKLNQGHCCAVPDQLRRWNRTKGRVIAGLAARRNAEISLYVGEC